MRSVLEAEHYVEPTFFVTLVVPVVVAVVAVDDFSMRMVNDRGWNPNADLSCLVSGRMPNLIVMARANHHIVVTSMAIMTMLYHSRMPDGVIMPGLDEYPLTLNFVVAASASIVPLTANNGCSMGAMISYDDLLTSTMRCAGIPHSEEEQSASGQEG